MKKYSIISTAIISLGLLAGCGTQSPAADTEMTRVSENNTAIEQEVTAEPKMTQVSEQETFDDTETTQVSETELSEQSVFEKTIAKIGRLEEAHHEIYSEKNPDQLIGEANLQWLIVDDSYAGSNLINSYLYEKEVASAWAIFEDNVLADEEFFDEFSGVPYSYDTGISDIRYFDGEYVSFVQAAYEYCGGAHGLPIWEGYAFNLETGERLLLLDLISNTEEELKSIVTAYFGEKIDADPEDFWSDAKETVYDLISLESTEFVLTDEGICFFIHPYSIAAYAAGFPEVTVPYSEFEMKQVFDQIEE